MVCPSFTLANLVTDPDVVLTVDAETEDQSANGTIWTPTSFAGWFDSTALRANKQEVPPIGELVTYTHELSRALAFEAIAHTTDPQNDPLGDRIYAALELAKSAASCVYLPGLVTVTDPVHVLHSNVKLTGKVLTAIIGESVAVRVQFQLTCEDPRRYDVDNNPFD